MSKTFVTTMLAVIAGTYAYSIISARLPKITL